MHATYTIAYEYEKQLQSMYAYSKKINVPLLCTSKSVYSCVLNQMFILLILSLLGLEVHYVLPRCYSLCQDDVTREFLKLWWNLQIIAFQMWHQGIQQPTKGACMGEPSTAGWSLHVQDFNSLRYNNVHAWIPCRGSTMNPSITHTMQCMGE